MRLGIKGKQVLGVTSIVGAVVVVLSVLHLARLASVSLDESQRARRAAGERDLPSRAQVVVGGAEPLAALRADPGLRSILESSLYSKNVTFAAIVDVDGIAVAHADRSLEGQPLPPGGDLGDAAGAVAAVAAARDLLGPGAEPRVRGSRCCSATREIGSIRIGVSTLLIRQDLDRVAAARRCVTALAALGVVGARSRCCWRSCCCGRFT